MGDGPKLNINVNRPSHTALPAAATMLPAGGVALAALRDGAPAWWRAWDAAALRAACEAAAAGPVDVVDADADAARAEIAQWGALASFMTGQSDALPQLDQTYSAHADAQRLRAAADAVHRALVICILDSGAMDRTGDWLARWDTSHAALAAQDRASTAADASRSTTATAPDLWHRLAPLAATALGGDAHGGGEAAAAGVLAALRQAPTAPGALSADERLIAAQVLMDYQFAVQRFDAFDFLANAVEVPALFNAASSVMQARWLFSYGYSQFHTGRTERAAAAWQRSLQISNEAGLSALALETTLALARGQLNSGQLDEAQAVIDAVQPQWGGGRTAQLIELLQLRARVQLLRGRAASALGLLQDALQMAQDAALPAAECASCLSDLAQVYVALGRAGEAEQLLLRLEQEHGGRSAQVYRCLAGMLRAWRLLHEDPQSSREHLAQALAIAQGTRYSMFFRLLPSFAAALCAMALRWGLAASFVTELVRARALPAPADAGADWPWPLWLRMLGGFEWQRDGQTQTPAGKLPQKPLELLRLLACQRKLAISQDAAMAAMWPDADEPGARKSIEAAVHRLRALLGDATLVWVSDGQVGLDPSRVGCDLHLRRGLIERIEALAMGRGGTAPGPGPGTTDTVVNECLTLLGRVVDLTRGDLLPGMAATPWLQAEQQRCRSDTVRAALATAALLEHAQAGRAEQDLLETALRIEPLSETLVARLMQAYERSSRRGDALRVFEQYRRHLAEHGATPGARMQAHWQALVGSPGRIGG